MKRDHARRVANWASAALTCLMVGACIAWPLNGDRDTRAFVEAYLGITALIVVPIVWVSARWLILNNLEVED